MNIDLRKFFKNLYILLPCRIQYKIVFTYFDALSDTLSPLGDLLDPL